VLFFKVPLLFDLTQKSVRERERGQKHASKQVVSSITFYSLNTPWKVRPVRTFRYTNRLSPWYGGNFSDNYV